MVFLQLESQSHKIDTQSKEIKSQSKKLDSLTQEVETQSHKIKSQTHLIKTQSDKIDNQSVMIESLVKENGEMKNVILQINGTLSLILDNSKYIFFVSITIFNIFAP